jgi:hypothetical protein
VERILRLDVLEEFAAAQSLGIRREYAGDLHLRPLESIRRAYRARHRALGLCRSCSKEAAPGRRSCPEHLAKNLLRAYASQERAHEAGSDLLGPLRKTTCP